LSKIQVVHQEYFLTRLAFTFTLGELLLESNFVLCNTWIKSVGFNILEESHVLVENVQWLIFTFIDFSDLLNKVESEGGTFLSDKWFFQWISNLVFFLKDVLHSLELGLLALVI